MSAPADRHIFVCGHKWLIDEIYSTAQSLGIDKSRLHSERFSSAEHKNDKPFNLQLACSQTMIEVRESESILEAMETAGVKAEFDCRVGNCGICAVKVISGNVEHRDNVLSEADKTEGLICTCVSRATSETLVLDI